MNFLRRILYLFRRSKWEDDLAEEMRLHMDLRAADQAADGASPPDAETHARRRFGNVSRLREESRAAWGWSFWDTLAQDVRYGVRTLAAHRGFTAAAVLSLALGIGANTAIFSILNAVMLRSLPVEDPRQLVQLISGGSGYTTNPYWEQVRDRQQAFSGVLAYSPSRFDLAGGGERHLTEGMWVSGDFFRVLGVPPVLGRVFTPDDDRHGGGSSGPVAVISCAFWQANFGGDPNVLGKAVKLDRHTFQIIGVTPPWFKGLDVDGGYGVAIPIGCEPIFHTDRSALSERSTWWLRMLGRLKPGDTPQRAEALMNSIAPEIARATLPPNWDAAGQKRYLKRGFKLRDAATGFSAMGDRYKKALFTLMAVVGLVLLIACANIANLLLARSAARQREISIRLAIGAARSRVIRQLLTESLLLAFAGASGGLIFSVWGSGLLVRLLTTTNTVLQLDLAPDLHLLGFTGAVAVLTGILFGLAPALRATRAAPNQVLKENARGTVAGSTRFALGKALVTAQVALSLVLLVGAGLFLGTFRNLLTLDPGFDRHNLLLVGASLPQGQLPRAQRGPLFEKILASIRGVHGVRSAADSVLTPLGNMQWNEDAHPEGYQVKPIEDDATVWFNRVSPGYFETMGTPVLMGRDFSSRDSSASPKVMVIGETAARHFWGAVNPIGKTIGVDRPGAPGKLDVYEVIGLVRDAKYGRLDELPLKTAYVPYSQDPEPGPETNYELRYDGTADALIPSVRAAIAAVDPNVSLEFRSLEAQVNDSLIQPRIVALLGSFFGFLALLLAMIGLYGVLSYTATQRRGEIGIRMALGAAQSSVIWLILRDVLIMLAIGLALGAAASLAAGRLVSTMLYGMQPTDPATLALAATVLGICAAFAGYLPARRASRMDPMAALRDE